MTDTPSSVPSGRLAFLHRRPFWAVILALQVVVSIGATIVVLHDLPTSIGFLKSLLALMGAGVFGLILEGIFNYTGDWVALMLFLILYSFCLHRTFQGAQTPLTYPILLTAFWSIATFVILSIASGL